MKSLLELIKSLYGPKAIASTIGTKTNVIRLPSNKLQKYIKTDLNIEAASDAAAQNAYNEMRELIPEVPKMNDAERLIFEGNLRRLKNKVKPEEVTAEVFKFETKEPVSKEGITQLIEEAGQTARPGTIAGNIESRLNRLKALSKEEGLTMKDVVGDFAKSQQSMSRLQDEGLVRATARQILINDIKAGKIKNITVEEAINMKEPIEPFRTLYGEGALEQLDSLVPELRSLRTETEAEKLARSKFEFEPKPNRPKESYTEEEMKKILEKEPKDEFAIGGRAGFKFGSKKTVEGIISVVSKAPKKHSKDIIETANLITPDYNDAKMAAQQISDAYAETKFGKDFYDLSSKQQNDIYTKAYDYVVDVNRQSKEGYKKIENLVEDMNQKRTLENFDIKDREPNKKGGSAGLDYLMGF